MPVGAITGVVEGVRNLDRSLAFYRDLLGLPVLLREETGVILGPVGADAATLTLHQLGERAVRGLDEIGPRQLWWSVPTHDELDDLAQRLGASDQTVHRTAHHGATVLRVNDPDHIVVHIVCWPPGPAEARYDRVPPVAYARE